MSNVNPSFVELATTGVQGLQPYQPGKPLSELERRIIVLKRSSANPKALLANVLAVDGATRNRSANPN